MAASQFSHVKITGITAVIPENCIAIDDEIEFFNNNTKLLERNKKILGLGTRFVVDDRTTNLDLCEAAAKDLLTDLAVDASTIDTVIAASSSHDYHYPASACILQGRLNLDESCSCFDVSGLSCSAYVHGLWLAHALIASGASKKCLLVAGDTTSRHSDRRNRNSNMLFGDAGTATLLESTEHEISAFFDTGARGKDWDKLIAPAGGYALPMQADIASLEIRDATGNVWRLCDDLMNGLAVFKFATEVGPKGIQRVLASARKSTDEIDYFAFHQANKQIVRSIASYAGLPAEKYSYKAFSTYGNCGAAAVTMDICSQPALKTAKTVCLATFGVGLSWGFAVVNMENTYIGGIRTFVAPPENMTRKEKIAHWIARFKEGSNA